ncbi:MAG: hypothetical protein LBS40_08135 [Burkholderiales bacterium]|jgi:hypothetical protein|nr:hypothetical protein [Burkholderiales bacterium]
MFEILFLIAWVFILFCGLALNSIFGGNTIEDGSDGEIGNAEEEDGDEECAFTFGGPDPRLDPRWSFRHWSEGGMRSFTLGEPGYNKDYIPEPNSTFL